VMAGVLAPKARSSRSRCSRSRRSSCIWCASCT
jgi:hypothetical protein